MSMMEYYETTARQIRTGHEIRNAVAAIRCQVPPGELWAQLAEEATELAHAALKFRRATGGANPTPVEPADAYAAVLEELADVTLLVHILQMDLNCTAIEEIRIRKLLRWRDRLLKASEE